MSPCSTSTRVCATTLVLGQRKRTANHKAQTKRTSGDAVIHGLIESLTKGIAESVSIIARLPEDSDRWIRFDADRDGSEFFLRKAEVFIKFTKTEVRALTHAIGKYSAAAWRHSASIAAARNVWATTLAEYNRKEGRKSTVVVGGRDGR